MQTEDAFGKLNMGADMRVVRALGALALVSGCLIGGAALAADWQIATVSGKAYRLAGTDWVRVAANDPIALGDTIKTLGSGRLTLTRDGVTVTIGPDSQVQIKERLNGKFTDVLQTAGAADVEVNPAKHIRLAVETPYMAAVVKGTVFSVATFKGYSETAVKRGRVAVIDVENHLEADVTAGQSATSGEGKPLSLSGAGALDTPEPFKGKVVTRAADGTLVETEDKAVSGASEDAKGKSDDAKGKSEDSGNSGKDDSGSEHGSSGSSAHGSSDSSDHGNSGSSEHGNSGSSDHGNSGSSDHGNSGGNSGHGSDD